MAPEGRTLRDLWQMHVGRMQAIRQQVLWQAALVWGLDKVDIEDFLRRGTLGRGGGRRVTMSPKLKQAVEEEIGRMNRERMEREGQHGQPI